MSNEDAKRVAAEAAAELLPESGVVGLGTGSTTRYFIDKVAELVSQGRKLRGVPTSQKSREQALALAIPLLEDTGPWAIDVCVDGADEVNPALDLLKGGGGAHTREKIVNQHSRQNIIIVDDSKLSQRLGEKRSLPVEVLCFGERATAEALGRYGQAVRRLGPDGRPLVTDSGNFLYDVETGPIEDPRALEAALRNLPGVVESGLFCGRADLVIVAGASGIRQLKRSG